MNGRDPGARRRSDDGAAAVEGGIVLVAILGPLLVGTLYFGAYFWREQATSLYPPRLSQTTAFGTCSTQQIIDRVKATAAESLFALNAETLTGLGIAQDDLVDYIDVTVTSLGSVGADVELSIGLPDRAGDNVLVRDITQRLSSVSVSTGASGGSACYR